MKDEQISEGGTNSQHVQIMNKLIINSNLQSSLMIEWIACPSKIKLWSKSLNSHILSSDVTCQNSFPEKRFLFFKMRFLVWDSSTNHKFFLTQNRKFRFWFTDFRMSTPSRWKLHKHIWTTPIQKSPTSKPKFTTWYDFCAADLVATQIKKCLQSQTFFIS